MKDRNSTLLIILSGTGNRPLVLQITPDHYVKQSSYMMDYLTAHGMVDFSAVTLETIYEYIRTLEGLSSQKQNN